ncbi:MAG: hypothetical protein RBT69_05020 [Spirochaetia bacterium]|jgi:hypothetical protein|nr:hypothetical protein [Spirochaetia bacterium]
MRTLILSILTALQLFIFTLNLFADEKKGKHDDFKNFFSRIEKTEIEKLLSDGRIDRYPSSHLDFKFLPELPDRKNIINDIEDTDFNTAIESVFYIDYRSAGREKSNAIPDSFNILTDIKKLEGITYYSHSRKEERLLFSKVEVESGETWPVTSQPDSVKQKNHALTAFIEDTTFGNNKYLIDYSLTAESLVMKMSNLERIKLAFFPVVKKNGLIFYTVVIPAENGLIVYCNGISKTIDSDFIRNRIEISIHNRVTALYSWFENNYIHKQ